MEEVAKTLTRPRMTGLWDQSCAPPSHIRVSVSLTMDSPSRLVMLGGGPPLAYLFITQQASTELDSSNHISLSKLTTDL